MINIEEACRLIKKEMPFFIIRSIYENDRGYLFSEDAYEPLTYMSKKTGKTSFYFPPYHTEEENNSWVEVEIPKEFIE